MKVDDVVPAPSQVDGDVSPINVSGPGLPDVTKVEEKQSVKPEAKKPSEPSFQSLPNFSRVTHSQLAHISFVADGRYQPIRPVSMHSVLPGAGK